MTKLGERRLWKARFRQAKVHWLKRKAAATLMARQLAHQMSQMEDPPPLQVDLPKQIPTIQ